MSNAIQSLATINSFMRTVLAVVIMVALGGGAYWGYRTYYASDIAAAQTQKEMEKAKAELDEIRTQLGAANKRLSQKDGEIRDLKDDIEEKNQKIDKLDTAMRLLKVDRRMGKMTVLDVRTDEDTGATFTEVEFTEVDANNKPITKPKAFRLKGDQIHVDCWTVKFLDKYIEQAEILRSTSMCMFKSIYGNVDGPTGSYPLDDKGQRPKAYAGGGELSDFEKRIWDDFWTIANDNELADEYGIRAIHGQVNYIKAKKGKTYNIQLRASDGVSILPAEDAKPRSADAA